MVANLDLKVCRLGLLPRRRRREFVRESGSPSEAAVTSVNRDCHAVALGGILIVQIPPEKRKIVPLDHFVTSAYYCLTFDIEYTSRTK